MWRRFKVENTEIKFLTLRRQRTATFEQTARLFYSMFLPQLRKVPLVTACLMAGPLYSIYSTTGENLVKPTNISILCFILASVSSLRLHPDTGVNEHSPKMPQIKAMYENKRQIINIPATSQSKRAAGLHQVNKYKNIILGLKNIRKGG